MSTKKMLIDSTQVEELRVAVVNDGRLEEFESETTTKVQNKGNIYLAKVVRIEPSLQAAFVDYGGDRHGFLPFNEIHPDYYRIPVADRKKFEEALKASQARQELMEDADIDLEENEGEEDASENKDDSNTSQEEAIIASLNEIDDEGQEEESSSSAKTASEDGEAEVAEEKEQPSFSTTSLHKQYKIQEVIKRRHIMLVQVVKEERGNKGASLTTYLSLPGRYCVLMPNAGHRSGGVSRKISDVKDRKRLRQVLTDLSLPPETGLIVRTAGAKRSKAEIKRDYDYLIRLWRNVREKTLKSIAPSTIYSEGNLVQRAIRDIYDRDIEEILVDGEGGYKSAKNFMKSLTPSHAKRVKQYKSQEVSLFNKFKVEKQIDEMLLPTAPLPSGGSIVINPTEALVAIDVNSGRATRERHIEETAYKTNMEAAQEIARQIRLRDLAGIIVIDFIDMQDNKRTKEVEKKFREAIQTDRARIQTSRISQFGLMEMSRQRLRPSILESHSITCKHCQGMGVVRSIESVALGVLRAVEDDIAANKRQTVMVKVSPGIGGFLLNQKRKELVDLEGNLGAAISILVDGGLVDSDFEITGDKTPDEKTSGKSISTTDQSKQKQSEKSSAKDKRSTRRRKGSATGASKGGRDKHQDQENSSAKTDRKLDKPASDVASSSSNETEDKDQQAHAQEKPSRSRSTRRRRRSNRRSGSTQDQQNSEPKAKANDGNAQGKEGNAPTKRDELTATAAQPDLRVVNPPRGGSNVQTKAPVTTKTPDLNSNNDKQGKKGWWQRLLES